MNRYEQLRYRAGLGLAEAAERAAVSQKTIGRLESGEVAQPSPKVAGRLAAAYGVSVDVLLGLAPLPEPPAPVAGPAS